MLTQVETTNAIKSIPWFFDLSSESILRLISIAELISFDSGQVIFQEGDQHPYLYIVLEGKVSLESSVPGYGIIPIFTAEALDVIGWSSLTPVVRQKPCTATATENTKLLAFNAQALMSFCETDCELGFVIMRRLSNIVASHFLTHRLTLLQIIANHSQGNSV